MRIANCTSLSISVTDPLLMYVRVLNCRHKLNDVFDNTIIGVSGCQDNRNQTHVNIIKEFFNKLADNTQNLKVNFFKNDCGNHGINIGTLIRNNWNDINDTILLMEDDDFIVNDNLLVNYLSKIQNRQLDFA